MMTLPPPHERERRHSLHHFESAAFRIGDDGGGKRKLIARHRFCQKRRKRFPITHAESQEHLIGKDYFSFEEENMEGSLEYDDREQKFSAGPPG